MKVLLSKLRSKGKSDKDSDDSRQSENTENSETPVFEDANHTKKHRPHMLSGKLTGKLLIASPDIQDPRFSKTVIYICSHTRNNGSIGFIINRLFGEINMTMLLEQLSIEASPQLIDTPVQFGGPMEIRRGFVLHSDEYIGTSTTKINNHIAVTSTSEILKDIAQGKGPKDSMLILGYSGWTQGQLEQEIKFGGWFTIEPDYNLLFNSPMDTKWEQSLTKLGVHPGRLSSFQGTA